jgi:DNA-binding transcriptional regulator YiaG
MRATGHKSDMTFAKLVTAWREKRQLNRAEAARLLDVPYRTLQDWEAGLRTPRGIALKLLTKRLAR